MQKISLRTKLNSLRKFDVKHKRALARLELNNLTDLFLYYPVRYEDFSNITKIKDLKINEKQSIRGIIKSIQTKITSRRYLKITEAIISDESGSLKIVWFNQPYLENYLRVGTYATLNGKVEFSYNSLSMASPAFEIYKEDSVHTGRIVPVYSETFGITSKYLRFILKPLLEYADKFEDFLPEEIKNKLSLIDLSEAIKQIHFPDSLESLKKARLRLAFGELFLIQLDRLCKKKKWQENNAFKIKFKKELMQKFVSSLPFELTKDQKVAAWEIFLDLEKDKPMNRLLEGEVGSGKTVVSAMSMYLVASAKKQSIIMAPTEILAKQHYETINKLVRVVGTGQCPVPTLALFTRVDRKINGKEFSKKKLIEKIKKGEIDILIGTHALIQEDVKFKNLALAIIDEQHRFGVEQRSKLRKLNFHPAGDHPKGEKSNIVPHLLSMTATPIPRTLALGLYGDLDISIIKQMPKGRKDVLTKLVAPYNRDKAYEFIRERINTGRQIFVVCPRIKGGENKNALRQAQGTSWDDVKAVEDEYEKLKKEIFPEFKIAMMHGKLKKEDKEKILKDFRDNKVKILVSTSVIEVGIDFPNATIMMIEGAERFGLAQLHQFRGRVGRGEHQSFCFLFSDSLSQKSYDRLLALTNCQNGFELAEKDLQLRGPGDVYGIRQSGIPDLKMASLMDVNLLKIAKTEAENLLSKNDIKKFPKLWEKLMAFNQTIHLE